MTQKHTPQEQQHPLSEFTSALLSIISKSHSREGVRLGLQFDAVEKLLSDHGYTKQPDLLVPGDDKLIYVGLAENAVDAHKFFSPAPVIGEWRCGEGDNRCSCKSESECGYIAPVEGKGWSEEEVEKAFNAARETLPGTYGYGHTYRTFAEYQRHLESLKK